RDPLQRIAEQVRHRAVGGQLEVAGARVDLAEPFPQGEEALPLDPEVEAPARALDRPLGEERPHGADARAETDLPDLAARVRRDQVRELRPASLEADGADVRDVVADDRERGARVDEAATSRTSAPSAKREAGRSSRT